jgi:hypothetical protein
VRAITRTNIESGINCWFKYLPRTSVEQEGFAYIFLKLGLVSLADWSGPRPAKIGCDSLHMNCEGHSLVCGLMS